MKEILFKARSRAKRIPARLDEDAIKFALGSMTFLMVKLALDIYLEYRRNKP